jgi:hypothetical protein
MPVGDKLMISYISIPSILVRAWQRAAWRSFWQPPGSSLAADDFCHRDSANVASIQLRRLRRQGKLNNARADRMMENVAVIPNARSVHTKKKASLELPISPPITPRVPLMWMTGMTSPRTDPRKMIMYPARRPASSRVPHSETTRTNITNRFTRPAGRYSRVRSAARASDASFDPTRP